MGVRGWSFILIGNTRPESSLRGREFLDKNRDLKFLGENSSGLKSFFDFDLKFSKNQLFS